MNNRCPKCGGELIHSYGLAGGGMGHYEICENEECTHLEKTQDKEDMVDGDPHGTCLIMDTRTKNVR